MLIRVRLDDSDLIHAVYEDFDPMTFGFDVLKGQGALKRLTSPPKHGHFVLGGSIEDPFALPRAVFSVLAVKFELLDGFHVAGAGCPPEVFVFIVEEEGGLAGWAHGGAICLDGSDAPSDQGGAPHPSPPS